VVVHAGPSGPTQGIDLGAVSPAWQTNFIVLEILGEPTVLSSYCDCLSKWTR
jgi:hypothetical protein